MRFLVDAQLPPALARMLEQLGHDARHVADIGMLGAPDSEIAAHAIARDATLITKDEDFRASVLLGGAAPVIVWIRTGNTTRAQLLDWFGPLVDETVAMIDGGERLIELR